MAPLRVWFTAALLLSARFLQAQTAQDILDKYVEAIGGRARVDSLKSFAFTCEVNGKPGIGYRQRPNLARTEILNSENELFVCTCFDGTKDWAYARTQTAPFSPSDRFVKAKPGQPLGLPFISVLVEPEKNGFVTTLIGTTKVDSVHCYELKLLNLNANREYRCFVDVKTFLLRQTRASRPMEDFINLPDGGTYDVSQLVTETTYENYRAFDGVLFPMREVSTSQLVTETLFKTYRTNLSFDPALFKCLPNTKHPKLD